MSHIFISYAKEDRAVALHLANGLEAAGVTTWYRERDKLPGVDYLTQANYEIDRCGIFLILVSPSSLRSDRVQKEVVCAAESGKWFFSVVIVRSEADEPGLSQTLEEIQAWPEWHRTIRRWIWRFDRTLEAEVKQILPSIVSDFRAVALTTAESPSSPRPRPKLTKGVGYDVDAMWQRFKRLWAGSSITAELPRPLTDRVHFTATAPPSVAPGSDFLLQVWGHLEDQRDEVLRRARRLAKSREIGTKGPVALARGTMLRVRLNPIHDLEVREAEDMVLWDGEIGNAAFHVSVSATAPPGPRVGWITFYVGDLAIAVLRFTLTVGPRSTGSHQLPGRYKRYSTAFASYTSENRNEVLRIIQGLQKSTPDLQVFLDVAALRSGARWANEIQRVIPEQDVFYLFWSRAASRSRWVEGEWRCALKTRGLDFIDPAPLDPPEVAPPPEELQSLHFGDWTLAYRRHLHPQGASDRPR